MPVGDLLKIAPATVLELDRKVGEAIDILVNNRLVARGEVVLVEDRLGVTMTEIIKGDTRRRKGTSMRLLIIGRLKGELVAASKIAMQRGRNVTQADGVDQGLVVLRAKGADLIMIDVVQPIARLVDALALEQIRTPVVACGTARTQAPPSRPSRREQRSTSRFRRIPS